MPTPHLPALQGLRHLNRSSPDFHDQLSRVLYGEEYQQWVQNLQGDDLMGLLDYLDKVRRHVAPPLSVQTITGSRWSRSLQPRFSEVPA